MYLLSNRLHMSVMEDYTRFDMCTPMKAPPQPWPSFLLGLTCSLTAHLSWSLTLYPAQSWTSSCGKRLILHRWDPMVCLVIFRVAQLSWDLPGMHHQLALFTTEQNYTEWAYHNQLKHIWVVFSSAFTRNFKILHISVQVLAMRCALIPVVQGLVQRSDNSFVVISWRNCLGVFQS